MVPDQGTKGQGHLLSCSGQLKLEFVHLFQPAGVAYQSNENIHKNLMTRKTLLGFFSGAHGISEGFENLPCLIVLLHLLPATCVN